MKYLIFSLLLLGCAEQHRQTEDYDLKTSADLQLTEFNHPHGYAKTECFACHTPSNIHNVDRLGDASFPLAKELVTAHGLRSCSGCHGRNGVTP